MLTVHVFNPIPGQVCPLLRIFTDRVRSTSEGYVLTRVCPAMILSVHTWGGTPARSRWGGYYPCQVQPGCTLMGGTLTGGTLMGGVPHLGYPPLDLARGYPDPWVPCLGGIPLVGPGKGYPDQGYPTSATPVGPGWGVPQLGGRVP